jgi:hypothetical protein
MIPKSGYRFSEKIMRKPTTKAKLRYKRKAISLAGTSNPRRLRLYSRLSKRLNKPALMRANLRFADAQ